MVSDPLFFANDLTNGLPYCRLNNDINVGVGVGFPALAFQNPAGLSATRGISSARNCLTEIAVRELRILLHRTVALKALLIAQLDTT